MVSEVLTGWDFAHLQKAKSGGREGGREGTRGGSAKDVPLDDVIS
jgi:hypothetical protein